MKGRLILGSKFLARPLFWLSPKLIDPYFRLTVGNLGNIWITSDL